MLKNKTKQKAKTRANTKCSDKRLNAYSPRSNNKTKSPDHITSNAVVKIIVNAIKNRKEKPPD